ncbi:MAG: hypothetical protein ABIK15_06120 [Pseudomonadota bacterium]
MSTDKKLEYIKMLDSLSEAFGESDGQSPDEIRDEFREEGFDIDPVETELLQFQKKISMAARRQVLDDVKSLREKIDSIHKRIIANINTWTQEQVVDRLKDLLSSDPEAVLAYRNLEEKKEEDIRAILIDLELARLTAEDDENGS